MIELGGVVVLLVLLWGLWSYEPSAAIGLAVLVAVLWLSAAAGASDKAERIASSHWPASPCHRHEIVEYSNQATLRAAGRELPVGFYMALAIRSECRVVVDAAQVRAAVTRCGVLAHEFGHLGGRDHSTNIRSIMYAAYTSPTIRCMTAFTPRRVWWLRRRAWRCRPSFSEGAWICRKPRRHMLVLNPTNGEFW